MPGPAAIHIIVADIAFRRPTRRGVAPKRVPVFAALCLALLGGVPACSANGEYRSMTVTATAYTMRASETAKNSVGVTAWGDRLEPGMKVIAVSRDLIAEGLGHETEVEIDGLKGTFVVRDKMHRRWQKKIDIFMGNDVEGAREWGRRKVTIRWKVAD